MGRSRVLATSLAVALALGVLAVPSISGAGAAPVLTVDPDSGPPGTEVSVSGFFPENCVVSSPTAPLPRILGVVVRFTPDAPDASPTVDISAPRPKDEAGGTIPVDASPGPATLTVYCLEQEVDSSIREDFLDAIPFTVRPGSPPTPPTTAAPTTSTTAPAPDASSAQPRFTG